MATWYGGDPWGSGLNKGGVFFGMDPAEAQAYSGQAAAAAQANAAQLGADAQTKVARMQAEQSAQDRALKARQLAFNNAFLKRLYGDFRGKNGNVEIGPRPDIKVDPIMSQDEIRQQGNNQAAQAFAARQGMMQRALADATNRYGADSENVRELAWRGQAQSLADSENARQGWLAALLPQAADLSLRGQVENANAARQYEDRLLARQQLAQEPMLRLSQMLTSF